MPPWDELERQRVEWGAMSYKFYQTQYDRSWRADDEKLAYPLYERCIKLGVTSVQFHKGVPFALKTSKIYALTTFKKRPGTSQSSIWSSTTLACRLWMRP